MTSYDAGHVVILEPQGTLCEGPECDAMERTLLDLAQRGIHVIVDLTHTHTLTAHGLGILAHAQKVALEHGTRIVVCGTTRIQRWILAETHLADVFTLHPDRTTALRALEVSPATWPQRAAS